MISCFCVSLCGVPESDNSVAACRGKVLTAGGETECADVIGVTFEALYVMSTLAVQQSNGEAKPDANIIQLVLKFLYFL